MAVRAGSCGASSCTGYCAICSGGCDITCSSQCVSGCYSGCSSCSGCGSGCASSCSSTCRGQCYGCGSGCSGSCVGSCSGNCNTTCTGGCRTGCTSCTSCSGTCTGCKNTCQGACTGTCEGSCDNGCTASDAMEVISNLGSKIEFGEIVRFDDISEIKKRSLYELKRRGKEGAANNELETGKITKANVDRLNNEIDFLDSSKHINVDVGGIIDAKSFDDQIEYIQTLMMENLK